MPAIMVVIAGNNSKQAARMGTIKRHMVVVAIVSENGQQEIVVVEGE